MMATMIVSFVTPAKAASYPTLFLDTEIWGVDAKHYVGDNIGLVFTYYPEYHHEKVYVYIYDSDSNLVASAEKQFYNSDYGPYVIEYTVWWDTTGYDSGKYTIVVETEFYSFNTWNESPRKSTYYIYLSPASERPSDGWHSSNGKWIYYENGKKVTDRWVKDSQGWCYLGSDGYCVTNTWKKDSIGWCYLDSNGRMATNKWIKDSQGWCYVGKDGYCVTNKWMKDSKGWVYLDSNGRMATNKWIKDSQGWCYVGANGYCVTNNWVKDSKGWVYLDANGRMVTNKWVEDSKGWCYVGEDGYAVTNCFKKDSIGWCYLDENGSMTKSEWVEIEGNRYYLNSEGYIVTGLQIIDGEEYEFDADGVLLVPEIEEPTTSPEENTTVPSISDCFTI